MVSRFIGNENSYYLQTKRIICSEVSYHRCCSHVAKQTGRKKVRALVGLLIDFLLICIHEYGALTH